MTSKQPIAPTKDNRLFFFDNVRYIVIIWVTIFHVASGLSGNQEFIRDSNSSLSFFIFGAYSVTVMMAIMFFAAGYFSTTSLRNRSTGAFLHNKLLRLGLPWLLGILFLGPTMPYMAYYSRSFAGLQTASYWDFWQRYMGSIFSDWLLPINFTANTIFHQQHFWFLSVLFVFFVVHALLRDARRRWGWPAARNTESQTISQFAFARVFFLAAMVGALGMIASSALDLPNGNFAFFFKLNLGEYVLYGAIFSLGVYAHARGWYANGQAPGWKAAGLLFAGILFFAGCAAAVFLMLGSESSLLLSFGVPAAMLLNLLSVLGFTSIIYRYMNKPSETNANFAANSYYVYILQYPVVLVFRLMTFQWETSAFVKFAVVSIPALVVSYLISEYLIRRQPRLSIAAAVVLHVGLCLFGLPRTSFSHQLLDRQPQMHAVIPAAAEPIPLMEVKTGSPNWDPDPTSVAWQDGRLYYGSQDGLQMMGAEGEWEMLDETLQINKLAPLGNNQIAVGSTNALAIWDVEQRAMQIGKEIDDGTLDEITSDGGGGLFYTVIAEDKPATLTHQTSKGQIETTEQPLAGAGVLGNDGQTLFWTADGELTLQALALDSEHQPTDVRAFAEIFMADGKYGRQRPDRMQHTASGLTVDRDGRLFLLNRVGLQVFDRKGQLLGVVQFPEQPFDCTFGGQGFSTLYVATASQVYALSTHTTGAIVR